MRLFLLILGTAIMLALPLLFLTGCVLPFARTYSLEYRDAEGRAIGTSVRFEPADPKIMRPPRGAANESGKQESRKAEMPPRVVGGGGSPGSRFIRPFRPIRDSSRPSRTEIVIDPPGAPFPLVVTRFPDEP